MEDAVSFLGLASIKGVGTKTLSSIANNGKTFGEVFDTADTADALHYLRGHGAKLTDGSDSDWRNVRELAVGRAHQLLREFESRNIKLVFRNGVDYPEQLEDLKSPPPWLFVEGSIDCLKQPSITVVGTRNPSPDGEWLAEFVGACLPTWGQPTVSGLAKGVDQAVHTASIRYNLPTIAFLGTGILSDYPSGSEKIRHAIVDQGGAIVTEYLPRESYSASNFVQRNRLQAALGRLLIPVEWSAKSGTAHTVRFASELKRPIAGLRLPDWQSERVVLSAEGSNIFTIPGDETEFRTFVSSELERPFFKRKHSDRQQMRLI